METKHIDTQAQLREAKTNLKIKMKQADKSLEDNWIFSLIKKFTGGAKNKQNSIDVNTENNLKFIASQDSKKINFIKIGKSILSIGIAIAAPLLAKKVIQLGRN